MHFSTRQGINPEPLFAPGLIHMSDQPTKLFPRTPVWSVGLEFGAPSKGAA